MVTNDLITETKCSHRISYLMNGKIGPKGCVLIKYVVRSSSKKLSISWKHLNQKAEESFVFEIQGESDKSQICLSTGSLKLYSPNIVPLNFSEAVYRDIAASGEFLLAYLLVKNDTEGYVEGEMVASIKVTCSDVFQEVDQGVKFSPLPIPWACWRRLSGKKAGGEVLFIHPIIASYVSNFPEDEKTLSVKCGSTTDALCH